MIFVGVDCHKDSLAASCVDGAGRELGIATFANTPRGQRALQAWARRHGVVVRFGLEGAGHYGFACASLLLSAEAEVVEVPAHLTARERRRLARPGKSDPGDALAIARVTAREPQLPPVRTDGPTEDLRLLVDYREQLVEERTRVANRLHADLGTAYPGYQERCPSLATKQGLAAAARLLRRDHSVRAELARRRLSTLRALGKEADELEVRIRSLVRIMKTSLTEIPGIGALLAARILGEVRDVSRFPSAACFAAANGTAPIPASSGRVQRHRLNRGGNRRLNRALHLAALVQSRTDERARAYMQRKQSQGKSWIEALRCLKRHLSNVVYRCLQRDLRHAAAAP